MKITADTKICMIIGDPVEHSLSPQIHNAGYESLGIDGEYVYIASHVETPKLADFIKGMRAIKIRGVAVKAPHKITIMQYLDEIDETAQKIGAVNTIVNNEGILRGYNTDWMGVVSPLEKRTTLKDKAVALIGAGGAARAASYGITRKGAKLNIFNRTIEKATELANEFGGNAYSLQDLNEIKNMDIVINSTSIGLPPFENKVPVSSEYINQKQIIYDLTYILHGKTLFIDQAEKKRAITITGAEMLLAQGFAQFKLFTNHDAPEEAMRKALI